MVAFLCVLIYAVASDRLETFEGYYGRDVSRILDSVVAELGRAPGRRFVWAEMSFFMRWYAEKDADVRARVAALVRAAPRLFVSSLTRSLTRRSPRGSSSSWVAGGCRTTRRTRRWRPSPTRCVHARHGPVCRDTRVQVTEGHEFLSTLFGVRPRIAWQVACAGTSICFAMM